MVSKKMLVCYSVLILCLIGGIVGCVYWSKYSWGEYSLCDAAFQATATPATATQYLGRATCRTIEECGIGYNYKFSNDCTFIFTDPVPLGSTYTFCANCSSCSDDTQCSTGDFPATIVFLIIFSLAFVMSTISCLSTLNFFTSSSDLELRRTETTVFAQP